MLSITLCDCCGSLTLVAPSASIHYWPHHFHYWTTCAIWDLAQCRRVILPDSTTEFQFWNHPAPAQHARPLPARPPPVIADLDEHEVMMTATSAYLEATKAPGSSLRNKEPETETRQGIGQKYSQNKCQEERQNTPQERKRMCDEECQNTCQKDHQNIVRKSARSNVRNNAGLHVRKHVKTQI